MKKLLAMILTLCSFLGMISVSASAETPADHTIVLSSSEKPNGSYTNAATLDGKEVTEYDYVWHADPSNSSGVYYTGEEPRDESVYIAHDITYYPKLNTSSFKKVRYDDDTEWAYYYTAERYTDFIFATLPVLGNSVPSSMMHSEEEAYSNAVLHITEAGSYSISGSFHGQIKIDLDKKASEDASCKVTLILNGVDITCTVAPAVLFYSVYECDHDWEDRQSYSAVVDTADAGANVILADGTTNNISGANVFRMLKAQYKSEVSNNSGSVKLQKKLVKTDAAFYSYQSMNVGGSGTLNITSTYEGLDSELHLTVNGGNINIYSQDDGMNVNEDNVSVLTFNGGTTHIFAGLGQEGDGIDSNGYVVVNGGTLVSMAKPQSDSGLDSDCGTYIHGGTVIALGSTMDGVSSDQSGNEQVSVNLRFSSMQNADEAIIFTDTDENVIFAYDPNQDPIAKNNARTYQGAVISSPKLVKGSTYHVYIGGDVRGSTSNGFFTNAAGFTEGAVMQAYQGTSGNPGRQPMGKETAASGQVGGLFDQASTDFTLNNTVNNFTGVSDAAKSGGGGSSDQNIFSRILSAIRSLFSSIRNIFSRKY